MTVIFQDLFPETLLVQNEGGYLFTDSVQVASHFHKSHRNVKRDIEKLISDIAEVGGDALKFEHISYVDSMNRPQTKFKMDQLAFSVLAGRFTGKKALLWQIQYHQQFAAMRHYIEGGLQRQADALYYFKPHFKTILAADAQNLPRSEIINLTGHKSTGSITANRRRMRDAGLLPAKNGGAA